MKFLKLSQLLISWLLLTLSIACNDGRNPTITLDSDSVTARKSDTPKAVERSSAVGTCKEETDKVTGKTHFAFAEPVDVLDDETGIRFNGILTGDRKSLIWVVGGIESGFRCVDKGDIMYILFRDGTRLQLKHDGKFSCDGEFVEYFGEVFGKRKALDELTSKEIEVIRLTTSNGSVEKTLSDEQSKQLLQSLSCLKAGMK